MGCCASTDYTGGTSRSSGNRRGGKWDTKGAAFGGGGAGGNSSNSRSNGTRRRQRLLAHGPNHYLAMALAKGVTVGKYNLDLFEALSTPQSMSMAEQSVMMMGGGGGGGGSLFASFGLGASVSHGAAAVVVDTPPPLLTVVGPMLLLPKGGKPLMHAGGEYATFTIKALQKHLDERMVRINKRMSKREKRQRKAVSRTSSMSAAAKADAARRRSLPAEEKSKKKSGPFPFPITVNTTGLSQSLIASRNLKSLHDQRQEDLNGIIGPDNNTIVTPNYARLPFSTAEDVEFQTLRALRASLLWAPSNYGALRAVGLSEVPAMDLFLNTLLDEEGRRRHYMQLLQREGRCGEGEERLKRRQIAEGQRLQGLIRATIYEQLLQGQVQRSGQQEGIVIGHVDHNGNGANGGLSSSPYSPAILKASSDAVLTAVGTMIDRRLLGGAPMGAAAAEHGIGKGPQRLGEGGVHRPNDGTSAMAGSISSSNRGGSVFGKGGGPRLVLMGSPVMKRSNTLTLTASGVKQRSSSSSSFIQIASTALPAGGKSVTAAGEVSVLASTTFDGAAAAIFGHLLATKQQQQQSSSAEGGGVGEEGRAHRSAPAGEPTSSSTAAATRTIEYGCPLPPLSPAGRLLLATTAEACQRMLAVSGGSRRRATKAALRAARVLLPHLHQMADQVVAEAAAMSNINKANRLAAGTANTDSSRTLLTTLSPPPAEGEEDAGGSPAGSPPTVTGGNGNGMTSLAQLVGGATTVTVSGTTTNGLLNSGLVNTPTATPREPREGPSAPVAAPSSSSVQHEEGDEMGSTKMKFAPPPPLTGNSNTTTPNTVNVAGEEGDDDAVEDALMAFVGGFAAKTNNTIGAGDAATPSTVVSSYASHRMRLLASQARHDAAACMCALVEVLAPPPASFCPPRPSPYPSGYSPAAVNSITTGGGGDDAIAGGRGALPMTNASQQQSSARVGGGPHGVALRGGRGHATTNASASVPFAPHMSSSAMVPMAPFSPLLEPNTNEGENADNGNRHISIAFPASSASKAPPSVSTPAAAASCHSLRSLPTRVRANRIPITTQPHLTSSLLLPAKGFMMGTARHPLCPAAQLLLCPSAHVTAIPPPRPMPKDLIAMMLQGIAVVGGFGALGARGHQQPLHHGDTNSAAASSKKGDNGTAVTTTTTTTSPQLRGAASPSAPPGRAIPPPPPLSLLPRADSITVVASPLLHKQASILKPAGGGGGAWMNLAALPRGGDDFETAEDNNNNKRGGSVPSSLSAGPTVVTAVMASKRRGVQWHDMAAAGSNSHNSHSLQLLAASHDQLHTNHSEHHYGSPLHPSHHPLVPQSPLRHAVPSRESGGTSPNNASNATVATEADEGEVGEWIGIGGVPHTGPTPASPHRTAQQMMMGQAISVMAAGATGSVSINSLANPNAVLPMGSSASIINDGSFVFGAGGGAATASNLFARAQQQHNANDGPPISIVTPIGGISSSSSTLAAILGFPSTPFVVDHHHHEGVSPLDDNNDEDEEDPLGTSNDTNPHNSGGATTPPSGSGGGRKSSAVGMMNMSLSLRQQQRAAALLSALKSSKKGAVGGGAIPPLPPSSATGSGGLGSSLRRQQQRRSTTTTTSSTNDSAILTVVPATAVVAGRASMDGSIRSNNNNNAPRNNSPPPLYSPSNNNNPSSSSTASAKKKQKQKKSVSVVMGGSTAAAPPTRSGGGEDGGVGSGDEYSPSDLAASPIGGAYGAAVAPPTMLEEWEDAVAEETAAVCTAELNARLYGREGGGVDSQSSAIGFGSSAFDKKKKSSSAAAPLPPPPLSSAGTAYVESLQKRRKLRFKAFKHAQLVETGGRSAKRKYAGPSTTSSGAVAAMLMAGGNEGGGDGTAATSGVVCISVADAATSLPSATANPYDAHVIASSGVGGDAVDVVPSHDGALKPLTSMTMLSQQHSNGGDGGSGGSHPPQQPIVGLPLPIADLMLSMPKQQRQLHQQVALTPPLALGAVDPSRRGGKNSATIDTLSPHHHRQQQQLGSGSAALFTPILPDDAEDNLCLAGFDSLWQTLHAMGM